MQNAGRKFGVFLCTKRKNFPVALILFNATRLIFLKLYDIIQALSKLNALFSLWKRSPLMRTLNKITLERMEEYIKKYSMEKGISPSYRNIMHSLGMSSLNLVQRYVLALEAQGRIKRTSLGNIDTPRKYDRGESSIVPLVGQIACGQPRFAEENIEESFSLPKGIFGNGKLFMLRAFGDSMIDAGISAGDLLVLRQQDYADEGEIVVALVGENATLKRFYKKGRKIILHPENKSMNDIIVDDCQIQGVLVSCIKMY